MAQRERVFLGAQCSFPMPFRKEVEMVGNTSECVVGGRIQHFLPVWRSLTSDSQILDMVTGLHVEFVSDTLLCQITVPQPILFSDVEAQIVDGEVMKLLAKGSLLKLNTQRVKLFLPFSLGRRKMVLFV